MPPLSLTLRKESPKGYAAMEELPKSTPSPQREPGQALAGNPFIRCPLPPFNATSDTLRQFNESGKVPTRRVIPLPAQVGAGGSTTIVQNTSVTSSSGGGSSSGTSLLVKTVTLEVGTLLPGDTLVTSVVASKIAVLMILGSSDLCEVRVYGDPNSQAADITRAIDSAPAFEVTQGLVTDIVLDSNPLQFNWQNRIFVNQDSPQTNNLYITVLNSTDVSITPSITITYLVLE